MKEYKDIVELEVLTEDACNRADLIKSMKDDLWSEIKIDEVPELNKKDLVAMLGQANILLTEVKQMITIIKGACGE